jgi:hypothetical protein
LRTPQSTAIKWAARHYGANVDDALNDAFGQRQISMIYTVNQYRVILEAAPQYLRDPSALEKLYVAPPGGGPQTPLATFARLENLSAPLSVAHQDQFPASTISFDLAEGYSLGDAVKMIANAEAAVGMPSSIVGVFSADAAEFNKSLASQPGSFSRRSCVYIVLGVLRKPPILHRADDSAFGGRWRAARAARLPHRDVHCRADRRRSADGHRQEKRDHDDRLRAGRRTR